MDSVSENPISNETKSGMSLPSDVQEDTSVLQFIRAVDRMSAPVSFIIFVLGCVCNPLAFAVFSRRAFRDTATSVYLRFLSLVDLGVILTGQSRYFLKLAFDLDIRGDRLSCKTIMFFNGFFVYLSSWTLVAVTTERFMSVVWPHRVKQWSSKTSAAFVIVLLVIFFAAGSLPFPLFYDYALVRNDNGTSTLSNSSMTAGFDTRICTVVYKSKLGNLLWWIFDGIFFAFLPSLVLISFNIVIVRAVSKSKKRVQEFKATPSGEQKRMDSNVPPPEISDNQSCFTVQTSDSDFSSTDTTSRISQTTHASINTAGVERKLPRNSPKPKETSLTFTLVIVSATFIVCTFPLTVYGFGPHYQTEEGLGPLGFALSDLLTLLVYTNNALNFLLYSMTGSKFRRETWALLVDVVSYCRK